MSAKDIAELVFESASDYAILTMDMDRRITFWSAGAEEILGWKRDEVLGRKADVIFTPEDCERGIPDAEMEIAGRLGRSMDERWHVRRDGSRFWASGEMMPLKRGGPAEGFLKILRDRTSMKRAQELQATLNEELGHRMKNMFAVVRAIVDQSLRRSSDLEAARQSIASRIDTMSRSHELLLSRSGRSAAVRTIVEDVLKPAEGIHSNRITIEGQHVEFGAQAALSLSLIIHELFTNALKYGALSTGEGRVDVEWRVHQEDDEPVFQMQWRESGGPPVAAPEWTGFGSRLINGGIAGASSEVQLEFAPEGVSCSVRTSMAGMLKDGQE